LADASAFLLIRADVGMAYVVCGYGLALNFPAFAEIRLSLYGSVQCRMLRALCGWHHRWLGVV